VPKPRIAIAGIGHESNTYSTRMTGRADFRILRGPEIGDDASLPAAAEVDWAPALVAYAAPNGIVARDAYEALKAELLERLSAATPLDGVLLRLHGAMEVEGIGDGETDLLMGVRDAVGPDALVSGRLDLHANLSPLAAATADVLTAHRTAPHVDARETLGRAARHLIRALADRLRPRNCLVKLPLRLPGEFAVTDHEPARSLYARLVELECHPGILDASLAIGCAWTDSAHAGVGTWLVAESEPHQARALALAQEFAETIWRRRGEFGPDVPTGELPVVLERALASAQRPVVIADSGDNPGAGGAGDTTVVLEALLAAGVTGALVAGIADAEAVGACCRAGEGESATLALGGKLDRTSGRPLELRVEVERVVPGVLAVVRAEGVRLIITSSRSQLSEESHYLEAGLDPSAYRIVVVKCGYMSSYLKGIAGERLMALTPGFTTLRPACVVDRATGWATPAPGGWGG